MISKAAKLLLIAAVLISAAGAVYMAFIHRAYAVGGCFAAAAMLLALLGLAPNKKRNDPAAGETDARSGEI